MDHLPEGLEDADAAAAWEAYRIAVWRGVMEGRLTPEMGRRLCDALGLVAWFQGDQAGRREPLPPLTSEDRRR